jgi:hypothetical protein
MKLRMTRRSNMEAWFQIIVLYRGRGSATPAIQKRVLSILPEAHQVASK